MAPRRPPMVANMTSAVEKAAHTSLWTQLHTRIKMPVWASQLIEYSTLLCTGPCGKRQPDRERTIAGPAEEGIEQHDAHCADEDGSQP